MRVEPIEDYIAMVVPEDVGEIDDRVLERLTDQAQRTILAQYRQPPRALLIEPVDWLITSSADEVERHQPAHDCVACRAGNDQARAFLAEHPDRRIAVGNLRYTEIWT